MGAQHVVREGKEAAQQGEEHGQEGQAKYHSDFFSDEKNFTQDQKVNQQNDRWLCEDPKEVPIVMSTKFPASVMVLGVVSNEGHMMPPTSSRRGSASMLPFTST